MNSRFLSVILSTAVIAATAVHSATAAACWKRPSPDVTFFIAEGVDMTGAMGFPTVLAKKDYCNQPNYPVDVYLANANATHGMMCLLGEQAQIDKCGKPLSCCTATVKVVTDPAPAPISSAPDTNTNPEGQAEAEQQPQLFPSIFSPAVVAQQFIVPTTASIEMGSCGIPVNFNDTIPLVALSKEDFGGEFMTEACGKCVKIRGESGKEVVAKVQSMCVETCASGTLQLSKLAVEELAPGSTEAVKASWEFVDC